MTLTLGDLATSVQMRRDNLRIRTDMLRLTGELSTGHKADLSTAVSGDFGPVAGIQHQLRVLTGYDTAAKEAALFTDYAQQVLERLNASSVDLAPALLDLGATGSEVASGVIAAQARGEFGAAVSALNAQVGGRSVFAGTATDAPALIPAEEMLTELRTLVAGETTAAGVAGVVSAWFGPGGGFETTGYTGSGDPLAPMRVSEGLSVRFEAKADDPALRDTLKGLAMAALLDGSPLAGKPAEEAKLAGLAGEALLGGQGGLVTLRAQIGTMQANVEKAAVRNGAETTQLEIARNKLTAIDPFKAATELQSLEVQLETLYTMTARLSRLKLTDFLR